MKNLALILTLIVAPSWAWAENYLCVSEESVAITAPKNDWKRSRVEDKKFIVSMEEKTVRLFGGELITLDCTTPLRTLLYCSGPSGQFHVNTKRLKFLYGRTDPMFIVEDGPGNIWYPFIQVGSCSKF